MERRAFLRILTGTGALILGDFVLARQPSLPDKQPPGPAFKWLPFGAVKPTGWILEQMRRDLHQGFAGHLDKLCHEASSDIFVTGRNSATSSNAANQNNNHWWNGETEGNWRTGQIMMACLTQDPGAMKEADLYVKHILASQDADGYLGAFAPDSRFTQQGELWTQTCLLRGLFAYAELTGNEDVFKAARRAADLTVATYGSGKRPLVCGEDHDLMFIDIMEYLHARTGDQKYPNFALWLYEHWTETENNMAPASLLNLDAGFHGHGVRTYEGLRIPLYLATATGRPDLIKARDNALTKAARYAEVAGGAVSQEGIGNLTPDPTLTEYEYCALKELQLSYESALQKSGKAALGDRVELIWFNAAQGARLQDGSALSYLTPDNRLRCDETNIGNVKQFEPRNKLSPTHTDVAVCCAPNASQIAAHYVHGMWMSHPDGGLVAALYGPCTLTTKIVGHDVRIEARTQYPFDHVIEFVVTPESETEFPLRFRNPFWSDATKVTAADAQIDREGDYWKVSKRWKAGDTVRLEFSNQINVVPAPHGEVAIQYGALLFAQPLDSKKKSIKTYPVAGFQDSILEPAYDTAVLSLGFPAKLRATAFGLQVMLTDAGSPYPFDASPVIMKGNMIAEAGGAPQPVTLIPMGCAAQLRRITFPLYS